jgi:chorismate dehydratase
MSPVRIGAVEYLNARPLVFGLEHDSRFSVRFDLPARCADLLHGGDIDLGLIPSIEFLRAPEGLWAYRIVPDLAVASSGPVASVAIYTTRDMREVRSIALDTSSRTSVALTSVMCARVFGISPRLERRGPDLTTMLAGCDAALIIGDLALFTDGGIHRVGDGDRARDVHVDKIDLGELWTRTTGLPFVYAFWAGRTSAIGPDEVALLQQTRDAACRKPEAVAAAYYPDDRAKRAVAERYLRDNIKYHFGPAERAGLEHFYAYAAEAGVVTAAAAPAFFDEAVRSGRDHV